MKKAPLGPFSFGERVNSDPLVRQRSTAWWEDARFPRAPSGSWRRAVNVLTAGISERYDRIKVAGSRALSGKVRNRLWTRERRDLFVPCSALAQCAFKHPRCASHFSASPANASPLIIGASLLMRVETSLQLMGYPGLAILCFMGAAGGGVWLLFSIFVNDHKRRTKSAR